MTVALIVTIYNDLEALGLIVESVKNQTVLPDELIIAQDNETQEAKDFIKSIKIDGVDIKHTFQPDDGWQKNKSTNNALRVAKSEYLIFVDGDCVPNLICIEAHKKLAQKNAVLCGRRTEPGEKFSTLLREKKMSIKSFVDNYYTNYFALKKDEIRHYDDGISLSPESFILKLLTKLRKKPNHIVGCHWSAFRDDLFMINGFDEDFILPTTGEDTDIERRLRHFGVKMNSCRYSASVIHLYHEKIFNPEITKETEALMDTKKDIFVCKNGLEKL